MAFDLKRMSYILRVKSSVIFKDRDREFSYQKVTKIKELLGVLKNITGFESTQQIMCLSVRELFLLTKYVPSENELNI